MGEGDRPVRMAPFPDEAEIGDDGYREKRQVQWGTMQVILQGDLNPRRFVSVTEDDPNAPIRGFIVTCSRNLDNVLGPNQPVYRIVAGVGGLAFDWLALAPGTYIVYAQSLSVYVAGNLLLAMRVQAWAGLTQAAPTLVLP